MINAEFMKQPERIKVIVGMVKRMIDDVLSVYNNVKQIKLFDFCTF